MPFQRTLKANVIDFIVRLFVQIFKDRRLVYFCTDCYELSQFVFFSIYYSRIHVCLRSVLWLV